MKGTPMRDSVTHKPAVVVGIDGSQAGIQAAEWAVDEAVSREVPLRLIYVSGWSTNSERPRCG
jgi:nucleotide-binding universal stress UspA family protein